MRKLRVIVNDNIGWYCFGLYHLLRGCENKCKNNAILLILKVE